MWKYNKHTIGNIVGHNDAKTLEFIITDVISGVPEEQGNYLYVCREVTVLKKKTKETYNYHERDLFAIRKASKRDLNKLLKEALDKEDFEWAGSIRDEILKIKR